MTSLYSLPTKADERDFITRLLFAYNYRYLITFIASFTFALLLFLFSTSVLSCFQFN